MKQTIKTSRTTGYLEKMFRSLNDHYFNGEVEEPIITIQSTPKSYGHVTVQKHGIIATAISGTNLTLTQGRLIALLKT